MSNSVVLVTCFQYIATPWQPSAAKPYSPQKPGLLHSAKAYSILLGSILQRPGYYDSKFEASLY